jgi:hypothetical protein
VLIFSSHSNSSNDVSRELILAANNDVIIIPFKIDNITPEPGKQYYLARTHWLDAMNPPTQQQIDKLVDTVRVFVPPPKPMEPPPPAPEVVIPPVVVAPPVPPVAAPPSPQLEEHESRSKKQDEKQDVKQGEKQVDKQGKKRKITWWWGIPLTIALLGGGLFALRNFITPAKPASPTDTPTLTLTSTRTMTPTRTFTPTSTLTATNTPLPSWVTDFSEPILANIRIRPPDFKDAFYEMSPNWKITGGEMEINPNSMNRDGALEIFVDPATGQSSASLTNKEVQFQNFALEFEANLRDLSPCTSINAHDQLDISWPYNNSGSMVVSIFTCPQVNVVLKYCGNGGCEDLEVFSADVDLILPVKFTIISKKGEYAVYLNNAPMIYHRYLEEQPSNYQISFALLAVLHSNIAHIELDNLSVWDLSSSP